MLYLIDPGVTAVPDEEANAFLQAARIALEAVVPISVIASEGQALAIDPGPQDGVVFFNSTDGAGTIVEALLTRAAEAGAVILPIALDDERRRPEGAVGDLQSFDLVDQLRRRSLDGRHLRTVARAFARQALSRIQPTYGKDRLRLFLCHRRADGEGLTARIDAALSTRHESTFRDLIEIQVGEPSQERIGEALEQADALIFLDTPRAGESGWVAFELSQALGRNIPIAWIRVEMADEERAELPLTPGPAPHLDAAEPLDDAEVGELADRILDLVFELGHEHIRASQSALRELKDWAGADDAAIETLDSRRLIFEVTRKPVGREYPVRAATDVVQMFARHPTDEDRAGLEEFLEEIEMGPHQRQCRAFDAAVMLDPTATGFREVGEWSVIEHPARYLQTLRSPFPEPPDEGPPSLLLLGAFPAGQLGQQEVINAVHAVSSTWLRLGGRIVFGGHPTFTPLVIEAARLLVPQEMGGRVTIFQSEWFVTPQVIRELSDLVRVIPTPAAETRDQSLTVMREAMIEAGAGATLALGGRTDEGGTHTPGIDEEIALARSAGIPVYLLGAPGGRAAEIGNELRGKANGFNRLGNQLGYPANIQLLGTDEYEDATARIWEATAPPAQAPPQTD